MKTFQPLHDRILVKPDAKKTSTASGIIIPDEAQEKSTIGTVVAVGPGNLAEIDGRFTHYPVAVDVGHVVAYGKYGGTEIEVDGEKHVVLKESEIIGIVR